MWWWGYCSGASHYVGSTPLRIVKRQRAKRQRAREAIGTEELERRAQERQAQRLADLDAQLENHKLKAQTYEMGAGRAHSCNLRLPHLTHTCLQVGGQDATEGTVGCCRQWHERYCFCSSSIIFVLSWRQGG